MRIRRTFFIFLHCLILPVVIALSCDKDSINPEKGEMSPAQAKDLTLSSLKKVDDYPLYIMTYYMDYQFDRYLQTGRWPDLASIPVEYSKDLFSCSVFSAFGNHPLLGRNFDYPENPVLILFTDPPDAYASISTVDLGFFGCDMDHLPDSIDDRENLIMTPYLPFDGLNENGVAVGMMAVPAARSPYDPQKVTIGEVEAIRLVLDYARDVDHAIQLMKLYNVQMQTPPIHYLIADARGKSAIIEYVNGEMIIIPNTRPWQVSTNFILHNSGAPDDVNCSRYRTAYQTLLNSRGDFTQQEGMQLLNQISQDNTIWSVVYALKSGEVQVSMGRKYDAVHKFQMPMQK